MITSQYGVIFDLDGVLWDTSKIHEWAYQEMFDMFDIEVKFRYESIAGMSTREAIKKLLLENMLAINNPEIGELASVKQKLAHQRISKCMPIFNDTFYLLKGLKSEGISYSIASSTSAKNLRLFVNHLFEYDLAPENYLSGDEVIAAKPNPEIYMRSKKLMSSKASKFIVVEDSMNGIKAALSAGCEVIGICNSQNEIEEPEKLLDVTTNRVELLKKLIRYCHRV